MTGDTHHLRAIRGHEFEDVVPWLTLISRMENRA